MLSMLSTLSTSITKVGYGDTSCLILAHLAVGGASLETATIKA